MSEAADRGEQATVCAASSINLFPGRGTRTNKALQGDIGQDIEGTKRRDTVHKQTKACMGKPGTTLSKLGTLK